MNILITYHTLTGNTEKIARAIYSEAEQYGSTELLTIDRIEPGTLNNKDILFLGSPCHAGDLAIPVKEFLKSLPESPLFSLAGFVTHAAPIYETRDFEQCRHSFEEICRTKNIEFLDFFDCQGFLTPELHSMVKKAKSLPDEKWEEMVQAMKNHPDLKDEKKAAEFASRIIRTMEQR